MCYHVKCELCYFHVLKFCLSCTQTRIRMWANAKRDGHRAKHRWRPLFNATKFGSRPLLDAVQ